jgi:hypothetical protein
MDEHDTRQRGNDFYMETVAEFVSSMGGSQEE